jgi:solute carrier family 10 (sodium/bile acid cotransporter), member 7
MPLVAYFVAMGLQSDIGAGLIVAACVPCTLASAAVWTRKGGGDETVPILVTLITNGLCFVTASFWLQLLLGKTTQIPVGSMVSELLLTVLLPITIAQLLNANATIHHWAVTHKLRLNLYCQLGILTMVLIGGAQIGLRWNSQSSELGIPVLIAQVAIIAVLFHLAIVCVGWWLASLLGFGRKDKIAVSIAGSQKTLMVGLQLSIDCGASILPMVAYHVMQLIADSYLVMWWSRSKKEPSPSSNPSNVPKA